MKNCILYVSLGLLVQACGGGGSSAVSTNFTTMTVFSDGAGVARMSNSSGGEGYYIAPNIVADVAASNASSEPITAVNILDYPIMSVSNGYNLRQGTLSSGGVSMNVVLAEKIGSQEASIAYVYNNSSDAIASFARNYSSAPTGTHTYNGMHIAGGRYTSFAEIGTLSLTANFSNNTFSINGSTSNSSLSGTGYIDASTGRISSGNLTFVSPDSTSYSATTLGNLSGSTASDVSGVYYTNDSNPDYAGAYAGSR